MSETQEEAMNALKISVALLFMVVLYECVKAFF